MPREFAKRSSAIFCFAEEGAFRAVAWHGEPTYVENWRREPLVMVTDNSRIPLARLIQTKQPIHVADLRTEPAYRAGFGPLVTLVDKGGARTLLIVPLLKEHSLVGAIAVYRQEVRPFTEKQIALITNFAAQAVIAIENTRLLNELRERTDDLTERTADLTEALEQQTATSDVLQVISSSPGDLQPVFEAMLEKAVRVCEAKFGSLYRWDDNALQLVATHNMPPAFAEYRRRSPFRPSPKTATARMVATKAVVHVVDVTAEQAYIVQSDPHYVAAVELGGSRTVMAVPMLKEDELIGAILVSRQEVHPFTDKQIGLVQNFAAQAVIAIENTRLLNELRESLAAADRHRRRTQGYQPFHLRPADRARHADRLCRPALCCRQGRHLSARRGVVQAGRELWVFARNGAVRVRTPPAARPRYRYWASRIRAQDNSYS